MRNCYERVTALDDSRRRALINDASASSWRYHLYIDAVLQCEAHHFGFERQPEKLFALVPGADLINAPDADTSNAVGGNVQIALEPSTTGAARPDVVVRARRALKPFEELTANWFPQLCYEDMLCQYGYAYRHAESCTDNM